MSKKINENAIPATVSTAAMNRNIAAGEALRDLFEKYPNASLRKLAAATGINYGVLLKKSKDPIPGEAYDPEATNWMAIADKLRVKDVDFTTLDWESMNAGPNRKGGTLVKDMSAFEVGMKVYLRKNNQVPYEIVYKTDTHIVIMLEGTSEPIAWAHNTFLINGPVFEPRAERKVVEEAEEA